MHITHRKQRNTHPTYLDNSYHTQRNRESDTTHTQTTQHTHTHTHTHTQKQARAYTYMPHTYLKLDPNFKDTNSYAKPGTGVNVQELIKMNL